MFLCPRRAQNNELSVFYQNVRGLNSKTSDFYLSMTLHQYDVIALTETWLNDSVHNAELFDSRYTVFRRDRGSRGGGVVIANRSALIRSCQRVPALETDGEHIWLRLESGGMVLFICVVYFPPSSTSLRASSFFQTMLAGANMIKDDNILMLGDFNVTSLHFVKCEVEFMSSFFNLKQI